VTTLDPQAQDDLSPAQQALVEIWENHTRYEFVTPSPDETMATMVDNPHVNHVPVLTGGAGRDAVRAFYATHFIPRMPPDLEFTTLSRTVGADRIVDELVLRFTHSLQMDWMLPGVPPTGRQVEIPLVAIVQFQAGKVAHEHIYWDQASVLVQLGLLDPATLPVAGVESAHKLLDPNLPSNQLIERAIQPEG
jgi:carboxymethylenebutenolidase